MNDIFTTKGDWSEVWDENADMRSLQGVLRLLRLDTVDTVLAWWLNVWCSPEPPVDSLSLYLELQLLPRDEKELAAELNPLRCLLWAGLATDPPGPGEQLPDADDSVCLQN